MVMSGTSFPFADDSIAEISRQFPPTGGSLFVNRRLAWRKNGLADRKQNCYKNRHCLLSHSKRGDRFFAEAGTA
jgi:hypothetical protein